MAKLPWPKEFVWEPKSVGVAEVFKASNPRRVDPASILPTHGISTASGIIPVAPSPLPERS